MSTRPPAPRRPPTQRTGRRLAAAACAPLLSAALLLASPGATAAASPAEVVRVAAPLSPAQPPRPPVRPAEGEVVLVPDAGSPAVAVFPDGRYLVLSRSAPGQRYTVQFYGADDQPQGEPFQAGPADDRGFAVTALRDLEWAIAWVEPATCGECNDHLILSTWSGSTEVIPGELVYTGKVSQLGRLVLAADGTDRLAVGWTVDNEVAPSVPDGSNLSDAYARIYDYGGVARSEILVVNPEWQEEQNMNAAAFLDNGDLVFVWESYEGEGQFYDVYRRQFDRHGNPREGQVLVNDFLVGDFNEGRDASQFAADVARIPGGYVIAWVDWNRPNAGSRFGGIVARTYFEDGTLEQEILVTDPTVAASYGPPRVAGDDDGSFTVLWTAGCEGSFSCNPSVDGPHGPDGSGHGVFARTFTQYFFDPLFVETETFTVPVETLGEQLLHSVHPDPAGGYLAVYTSRRRAGGIDRLMLRRLRSGDCHGLCLAEGRFDVTAFWRDPAGRRGAAEPVTWDRDWAAFSFFRSANVELAVKVLDGRVLNDHYWLFAASLTNVEHALDVWDLETGQTRRFENRPGVFASRGDVTALPSQELLAAGAASRPAGPGTSAAAPASPPPILARLPGPAVAPLSLAPCEADELCLRGDRFLVEVEWQNFQGGTGQGVGARFSDESAWFWFFRPGNPELLVKVLDGGPVNGYWWVFYGALSNVGFDLTVTDRATGEPVTYNSPLGAFAAAGETDAFLQTDP